MSKQINSLSKWTAILVGLLTVLSLALSYQALMDVAYNNGLNDWRAYFWPLLIDGALIVFSLAVVVAVLNSTNAGLRWAMVGLFSVATVLFNLADVDNLPKSVTVILPFLVAVIPPLALFMSFETLMSIVRQTVKRQEIVRPVSLPVTKLTELSKPPTVAKQKSDTKLTKPQRKVAALIEAGDIVTVSDIVAKMNVSERTAYRYAEPFKELMTTNGK